MDNTSSTDSSSNGERKAIKSQLTLAFDHDTFALDIKGEAPSIEVFLSMIEQAKRYFEQQLRAQAAMQLQAQIARQQQDAQIKAMISGRGN